MSENQHLQDIATAVIDGETEDAIAATRKALEANVDPLDILNKGLMDGADEVGKRFERNEYFLPELMMAGRALKGAMEVVKPILLEKYAGGDGKIKGRVISATIQTDIHDSPGAGPSPGAGRAARRRRETRRNDAGTGYLAAGNHRDRSTPEING